MWPPASVCGHIHHIARPRTQEASACSGPVPTRELLYPRGRWLSPSVQAWSIDNTRAPEAYDGGQVQETSCEHSIYHRKDIGDYEGQMAGDILQNLGGEICLCHKGYCTLPHFESMEPSENSWSSSTQLQIKLWIFGTSSLPKEIWVFSMFIWVPQYLQCPLKVWKLYYSLIIMVAKR